MHRRPSINPISITITLLALVVTLAYRQVVEASPVTSGSLQSGAEIYQGLIAVTTGEAGSSLMEIGDAGTTIASSGDLYLRPNGLSAANGLRLERVGTKTNVHARGGVCLDTCRDTWPPSGAGTSYWQLLGTTVEPLDASNSLNFAKSLTQPYVGLDLTGKGGSPSLNVSNASSNPNAAAAKFGYDLQINGQLDINPRADGQEILLTKSYCDSNTLTGETSWYQGQYCNPTLTGTANDCTEHGGDCYCRNWGTGAPEAICKTIQYKVWHAGNDGHTAAKKCWGGVYHNSGPIAGSCNQDPDCGPYSICTYTGLDAAFIDGWPVEFWGSRWNFAGCGGESTAPGDRCLCLDVYGVTKCTKLQP